MLIVHTRTHADKSVVGSGCAYNVYPPFCFFLPPGDDADSNSTWYYIGGAMGAAILVLNIVVVILGAKSCKKQDTVAMLAGNQAYVR